MGETLEPKGQGQAAPPDMTPADEADAAVDALIAELADLKARLAKAEADARASEGLRADIAACRRSLDSAVAAYQERFRRIRDKATAALGKK